MEIRVFVVEDSASGRALLDDTFASLGGFRLLGAAPSEPEAREWLKEHDGNWDLVLIDLVMEQGSGFGVIRAARQCSPDGIIVVFSGYATPQLRQRCMEIGANAAFDKTELRELRRWLEKLRDEFPRRG